MTALEEETFYTVANSPRFRDYTPEQIVAMLAEEGVYHASASTLYRILRKRKAIQHRLETKKPVKNHKAIPILVTGPNQVWAWDITWLKSDVVGLFKYAYTTSIFGTVKLSDGQLKILSLMSTHGDYLSVLSETKIPIPI